MSSGQYTRLKTWVQDEKLLYSDLNAEFNNIITNSGAAKIGGTSDNLVEFQATEDPGAIGSEDYGSSVSVADEIERLRFVAARMIGSSWYDEPAMNIAEIASELGASSDPSQYYKIISGRTIDGMPMYLSASNSTRKVTVLGASTNLVLKIANTTETIDADYTMASEATAPESSNNTATLADIVTSTSGYLYPLDARRFTSRVLLSSVGSNISAKEGRLIAFKVDSEPMIGVLKYDITEEDRFLRYYVDDVRRGYIFNSSDTAVSITSHTGGATVTLLRIAQIFITAGGTVYAVETPCFISGSTPASAATNDHWYDTSANLWKRYSGSAWVDVSDIHLGLAVFDATTCLGTRSNDFYADYSSKNSIKYLQAVNNVSGESYIIANDGYINISIYGKNISIPGNMKWRIPESIDTGVMSTGTYYLYISSTGVPYYSLTEPMDRLSDLKGYYHKNKPWRCVGTFYCYGTSPYNSVKDVMTFNEMSGTQIQDGSIPSDKFSNNIYEFTIADYSNSGGAVNPEAIIQDMSATTFISNGRPMLITVGAGNAANKFSMGPLDTSPAYIKLVLRHSLDGVTFTSLSKVLHRWDEYYGNSVPRSFLVSPYSIPKGSICFFEVYGYATLANRLLISNANLSVIFI